MKTPMHLLVAAALAAASSLAQSATPRAAEDASGEVTRWAAPPARVGKSPAEAGAGQKSLNAPAGKQAGARAAKPGATEKGRAAAAGKAGRGGKKAVPARRR